MHMSQDATLWFKQRNTTKCLPGQGWCSRDAGPNAGSVTYLLCECPQVTACFLFHKTGRVSKPYWAPKNWYFWTVVLEKILESVLESKESVLKEINSECSLEGLMLKLKLQYSGHVMSKSWLVGKDPEAEKDWGQAEKGWQRMRW